MAKALKTKKRHIDPTKTKAERDKEAIRDWTDIFRQNPHRAISTLFGCETLSFWQDLIIYVMFISTVFFGIMTRGIGKSYLIGWFCIVWCTVYPNSRIVIASGVKSQARLIVTQKIMGEIYNQYPMVREVIDEKASKTSINDTYVKFHNGSEIVVVTSSDNSRGNRAMIVIYEESRTIDIDMKKNVLAKFKNNGSRVPRYRKNPKYRLFKAREEKKKDIHISSGWFEQHDMFPECMAAFDNMLGGGSQYAFSFNWAFPCVEGLFTFEDDIEPEMNSPSFSKMWWAMENEGLFWGESEGSLYAYNDIVSCMNIPDKDMLRAIPNECYLDEKLMADWKKKYYKPKKPNELRILSCDIALRGGNNDNAVYSLTSAFEDGDRYTKKVNFIEHHNNAHSEFQSIRIKQLYEDFDADIIMIDVNGNGSAVFEACTKWQTDIYRDKKYPPFTVFNREDLKDKIWDADIADANACIFAVIQDSKFNHNMLTWLSADIENSRISFPISSGAAEDTYLEESEKNKLTVDDTKMTKHLSSHYESDLLLKEMTALEVVRQNNSPYLKVENPTMKKDRFSSVGFANHYIHTLEATLTRKKKKKRGSIMSLLN